MHIQMAARRSHGLFTHPRSIAFQARRYLGMVAAALILTFAGAAQAVTFSVGLAIENEMDSNGNITVIDGSKMRVAYTVNNLSISMKDKESNKADQIQLVRVEGDEVVSSVARGKKKSGTVSLVVKNSENEKLYVRYVRKGKDGEEITRISHPDDPGHIPLSSIPKASISDLAIGLNALETEPGDHLTAGSEPGDLLYWDGEVWQLTPPAPASSTGTTVLVLVEGVPVWTTIYVIGAEGPAGGIVFQVTNGGRSGLEAAPVDQSGGVEWGCVGAGLAGADGVAIGTGEQNTIDILAGCADSGIAARLADSYTLNDFADWYLPSYNELALMEKNIGCGNLFECGLTNWYWSSSEQGSSAWAYRMSGGATPGVFNKSDPWKVRAVRSFP